MGGGLPDGRRHAAMAMPAGAGTPGMPPGAPVRLFAAPAEAAAEEAPAAAPEAAQRCQEHPPARCRRTSRSKPRMPPASRTGTRRAARPRRAKLGKRQKMAEALGQAAEAEKPLVAGRPCGLRCATTSLPSASMRTKSAAAASRANGSTSPKPCSGTRASAPARRAGDGRVRSERRGDQLPRVCRCVRRRRRVGQRSRCRSSRSSRSTWSPSCRWK